MLCVATLECSALYTVRRIELTGFWPKAVGANLFAKTVFQAIHIREMYRPLRGQVRSHTSEASPGPHRGVQHWRNDDDALRSHVGVLGAIHSPEN
ncbi:hypothetical protein EGU81_01360 [Pseudomonas syringae pv. theae]|nr:hypothetical protein [Pseudomonas syringae pv. theae]